MNPSKGQASFIPTYSVLVLVSFKGFMKINNYSKYSLAYSSLLLNHQLSTWFPRKVLSTMMIPATEEINLLVINPRVIKLHTHPLWLLQYLIVSMGRELS
jgi:hypothetical protein